MLQYCNMYDHCHVPTLHTRGSSRLLAARVDWMPMSSLNFCVIATEICLTLDNIGYSEITLQAAKEHMQDNEMTEVEGEDLFGWADGTLRKHPVLLNLNRFYPQFMNLNLQKLYQGSMDPTQANRDLIFDPKQALDVRQWFFSPDTPITPGAPLVAEAEFHTCTGQFRERYQKETVPHLMNFLNMLGTKNKVLVHSFMEIVPKDIGAALGQAPTQLPRGASANGPSPRVRGGTREEAPPVTPAGCSSSFVEPMSVDDEEEDDPIDLYGGGALPNGMSSTQVLAAPSKKEAVVVHAAVRWDSQISYNNSTELQHQEIEVLLAARQIGEGGLGLVLWTETLEPPDDDYAVRGLDLIHIRDNVIPALVRSQGGTSHLMFAMLNIPDFDMKKDLEMKQGQLRLTHEAKKQFTKLIQNKDVLPEGWRITVIGGNHTMHAKKQLMQDPRYKEWDKLKTITMQVWVNLPPSFANYLGWKHNMMTKTQMETYLLLSINRIHDDWVEQLAIWQENKTMPEEVLATGYKGYDGDIGIQEYNARLRSTSQQQVWTQTNHQQWNIDHVTRAFGIESTKEAYMGKGDLSQCAAFAQRSTAVWESWKSVENAINRYDVVLPMHVSMIMNLLASRVTNLSHGPESIHSRRE